MIIFKRVYGKNFLSYEEFDFVFSIGKHLVAGTNKSTNFADSNGSGKSSLFTDAITWCVFKKTTRDRDVSRDGKGDCMVGLEFSIAEDDYELIRSTDKKDSVKLLCNGENITPRNSENIEDVIERTIGIPYDLFVIIVTVLQGLPINFSTLTPTLRKGIIESMMSLDNWDVISKLFQGEKKSRNDVFSDLNRRYIQKEHQMVSKNSEISTIRSAVRKNSEELMDELKDVKLRLKEAKLRLNGIESRREMISTEDVNNLQDKLDTLSSSCTIIQKQINELVDLTEDGVCPTCGQSYPVTMISESKEKLEALDSKLPKLQGKRDDIASTIRSINSLDNEANMVKRETRMLQSNFDHLLAKINSKEKEDDTSIDTLQNELDELVADVNVLNEEMQVIRQEVEGCDYILSLLQPSSSFRTKILENYLGYINAILAEISPNILDGMIISLGIDKKANGIEININGGDLSYKSLSGGEKRRVDIIIVLSLQRFLLECTGISTNLLVFDEIFDSLDNIGIQMILNCIDMIFDDNLCVYIITHKTDFRSSFESIVEIEKEGGVSRLC